MWLYTAGHEDAFAASKKFEAGVEVFALLRCSSRGGGLSNDAGCKPTAHG